MQRVSVVTTAVVLQLGGGGMASTEFAAAESDVPAKRARADGDGMQGRDEEIVRSESNAATRIVQQQEDSAPMPSTARANLSRIMPGWFSEVSPMWPGRNSVSVFICGSSLRIVFGNLLCVFVL